MSNPGPDRPEILWSGVCLDCADRDRRELLVMLDPAGHPFCLCFEGESRLA